MTTNKRREILPLPDNLTPSGRVCFCINIPDDPQHFAAFWGALNALTKRYSWGKPLTADSETVASYWRDIIADNRACFEEVIAMANRGCGCDGEPVYRFNANGIREVSNDGGDTWTNDLTDPRTYGTILPPPLWLVVGDDNRCEGAATAAANMENLVSELVSSGQTGASALTSVIVALICAYTAGTACAVAEVIGSVVLAIVEVGLAAIGNDMTAQVYEDFKCVLFCRIENDASFTEAGWQGVKSDIANQFTGNPEFVLWNIVNAMGAVGLTNLARTSIAGVANCDDCPCGCENISLGAYGENLQQRSDLGQGWWQVSLTFADLENCESYGCYWAEILVPGCCTHADYEFNPANANTPLGHRQATDCEGNTDFLDYLHSGTVENILFRGTDPAVVTFRLVEA